jgi:hypothetical protein
MQIILFLVFFCHADYPFFGFFLSCRLSFFFWSCSFSDGSRGVGSGSQGIGPKILLLAMDSLEDSNAPWGSWGRAVGSERMSECILWSVVFRRKERRWGAWSATLTGVRACVRVGFQSHISRTGGPAGQHARTHAGHSLTPTGSRPSVRATIPFVTTDCNCSSISNSEFRHPTLLYPFSRKSLALLYSDRSMSSPLPTNATYREIKWSKRAYLFFIQRDRCTSIFMILSFPCCKGKQREEFV